MTKIMTKHDFCICLEALHRYALWENTMYNNGIDFGYTPVCDLAEKLQLAMCGFDSGWSFDKKLGFDWIIKWTFDSQEVDINQTRHGKSWHLEDAGILYDFLVFMNEYGWEDD